ncbi:hypothetical protein CF326_g10063, partial [Tilletia indica]
LSAGLAWWQESLPLPSELTSSRQYPSPTPTIACQDAQGTHLETHLASRQHS